jgi:hypothetical protein
MSTIQTSTHRDTEVTEHGSSHRRSSDEGAAKGSSHVPGGGGVGRGRPDGAHGGAAQRPSSGSSVGCYIVHWAFLPAQKKHLSYKFFLDFEDSLLDTKRATRAE